MRALRSTGIQRWAWRDLFAILVLVVSTATTLAQDLTLSEALRLADESNLALQAGREETAIAEGRVTEVRSLALPRLDLIAQYVRVDDVASLGEIQLGQLDNYEAAADISQVLFAGGGVRAAQRLAREYEAGVREGIARANQATAYEVHNRFNLILLARENLGVMEQDLALARRNLADVRALLAQGMARRFDQLRAEEQVSSSEADRLAAANALAKTRLDLLRFLDLPLDEERSVAGSLMFETEPAPPTNAVTLAMEHRPDLAAARRAVAARKESVTVAKSGRRPRVAAFGQVRYGNPDRQYQDEWEDSWMVGVRAELPLFDGMETRGKVSQERGRLRQADIELRDLIAQIGLEVTQAEVDLETAARLVKARDQNVKEAEEALRLAQRSYAEGLEQQIDVIAAQLSFTNSRQRQAVARYEQMMAYRRLQLAMGLLPLGEEESGAQNDAELNETRERN